MNKNIVVILVGILMEIKSHIIMVIIVIEHQIIIIIIVITMDMTEEDLIKKDIEIIIINLVEVVMETIIIMSHQVDIR